MPLPLSRASIFPACCLINSFCDSSEDLIDSSDFCISSMFRCKVSKAPSSISKAEMFFTAGTDKNKRHNTSVDKCFIRISFSRNLAKQKTADQERRGGERPKRVEGKRRNRKSCRETRIKPCCLASIPARAATAKTMKKT